MRVLYVLTSLGLGGPEKQALAVGLRMAERGHRVAFLILKPRLKQEWPTALETIHLDMSRNPVNFAGRLWRARRLVSEFRPDIVHSHGFHANVFARLLKLLVPRLVIVSTVHNVYEGGRLRMMLYRLTDGLSRRTIAVSEAVAERFIRIGAVRREKCNVIQNGIEISEFEPDANRRVNVRAEMGVAIGAGSDVFVWLAVGRIAPAKDYPNLLRAFALLRVQFARTQLWIAGEDARGGNAELEALSNQLGLSEAVRWLGLRRDIAALLNAADAFVLASAREGMPLAVGEAMATEKPVVATDVGGVRELIGNAGIVVPAKNPDALAEAMAGLMRLNAEKRSAIGRAARERVIEHFGIEQTENAWKSIYREIAV